MPEDELAPQVPGDPHEPHHDREQQGLAHPSRGCCQRRHATRPRTARRATSPYITSSPSSSWRSARSRAAAGTTAASWAACPDNTVMMPHGRQGQQGGGTCAARALAQAGDHIEEQGCHRECDREVDEGGVQGIGQPAHGTDPPVATSIHGRLGGFPACRYDEGMDVLLVIVVVGCALAGLWWGALRMLAALAAAVAAVAAGRWVAPAAVSVVAGPTTPSPGVRIAAIVVSALVAAVVVLVAAEACARGWRCFVWVGSDRLAGMAVSGGLACLVLSLLLALAAVGGRSSTSPFATFLTAAGQTFLATHTRRPTASARAAPRPPPPAMASSRGDLIPAA